eukprot:PITA_08187
MDECKAVFVRLQQDNKLQVDDGSKYANATLYRQLVGSLIYLTTTRPDLAYAVSVLSQLMTQPHENHWLAAKGVLRVISWCKGKQHTVALSSAEAEYQVMCKAACEAAWLRRLLQDEGEEPTETTVINCDNKSSIKLAYNPVFHKNTQLHFVKEKVQSKEICVEYCNSCDNMADIFTKPLGRLKFELFRDILGVFKNPFSIKGEC